MLISWIELRRRFGNVRICWKGSGEKQGAKKLLNDVLEVIENNSLSDADPKNIQSVKERAEKM